MSGNVLSELDGLDVNDIRRVFRDRLLARMREVNLRAADVARLAKISKDSMSAYATMRSLPNSQTLAKIAKVLSCKPVDLMPPSKSSTTIMELREHTKPGWKVLILRAPLPTGVALEFYERALKETAKENE